MLQLDRPAAITMWDFSWLERRWPGAGFADWDAALDGLVERGYDAVRIDAYPHLVANGPEAVHTLHPAWYFLDWGAPSLCDVRVLPELIEFVGKCRDRGVRVMLSTWYREDLGNVRMDISSPQMQAEQWINVVRRLEDAGLLEALLCVDLCNEWPVKNWAPFFQTGPDESHLNGNTDASLRWTAVALEHFKSAYPDLPALFSLWPDVDRDPPLEYEGFDAFDPHLWLSQQRNYYAHVGYQFGGKDLELIETMAAKGKRVYEANREYWHDALRDVIDRHAAFSRKLGRGMITTECWGPVDYKDGPRFAWDWVLESCALGTEHAAATGRWLAIATSNFCAPQYVGMWREVEWHQRLTGIIKSAAVDEDLRL